MFGKQEEEFHMKHPTEEEYWETHAKVERTAKITRVIANLTIIIILSILLRIVW
jgi:hypothetical protein